MKCLPISPKRPLRYLDRLSMGNSFILSSAISPVHSGFISTMYDSRLWFALFRSWVNRMKSASIETLSFASDWPMIRQNSVHIPLKPFSTKFIAIWTLQAVGHSGWHVHPDTIRLTKDQTSLVHLSSVSYNHGYQIRWYLLLSKHSIRSLGSVF